MIKSEKTVILRPVHAGVDATLSNWSSDSFLKGRSEEDCRSKNDWRTNTNLASDQAEATTEQFFTSLHTYAILENRTLVKIFICTIAPAQLRLAVGFR